MTRQTGYYWIKWVSNSAWQIAEYSPRDGWLFCGSDEFTGPSLEPDEVGPMIETHK